MSDQRVVVVVEDDTDIRNLLEAVLAQSGFDVHTAATGVEGVELVRTTRPDVVTLDLGLPDIDGFEVARRIRSFSDTYVLMLTAREDEIDTVEGFAVGADDYLTKPFRPRELRARVDRMLRRSRNGAGSVSPETGAATEPVSAPAGGPAPTAALSSVPDENRLEHKGLELDTAMRIVAVEGRPLELTKTEFDLLWVMLDGGRRIQSKRDLVRRLQGNRYDTGGYISEAAERSIEVHMGNLRRKLGDNARAPR